MLCRFLWDCILMEKNSQAICLYILVSSTFISLQHTCCQETLQLFKIRALHTLFFTSAYAFVQINNVDVGTDCLNIETMSSWPHIEYVTIYRPLRKWDKYNILQTKLTTAVHTLSWRSFAHCINSCAMVLAMRPQATCSYFCTRDWCVHFTNISNLPNYGFFTKC